MESSLHLAGIIGPILAVLSLSEFLNYRIWKNVSAPLVYLNGLFLLTGGLIIVRIHNNWTLDWTLMITLLGWLTMIMGLFRMFFPSLKQPEQNLVTNLVLLILFLCGIFLSIKAYLL